MRQGADPVCCWPALCGASELATTAHLPASSSMWASAGFCGRGARQSSRAPPSSSHHLVVCCWPLPRPVCGAGTPEDIPKALTKAKDKSSNFRLMGFGHRWGPLEPHLEPAWSVPTQCTDAAAGSIRQLRAVHTEQETGHEYSSRDSPDGSQPAGCTRHTTPGPR